MELVYIEYSKAIYLMDAHRPAGQLYLPDLVVKTVQRYSFIKSPTLQELVPTPTVNDLKFFGGKFRDVQIAEFAVYRDGIIAGSSSDTDILEHFIEDILGWAQTEFGIMPTVANKTEMYFESALVVKSRLDLAAAMAPRPEIVSALNAAHRADGYKSAQYIPSGFLMDCDPHEIRGRRKPLVFQIERRIGMSFADNIFYSRAPLRTKDHLSVLHKIEETAAQ